MVIAPVSHLVGLRFDSWPGHPGVPSLSKSDEEKRSGLHSFVPIQCVGTVKYCKSLKNSLLKNICHALLKIHIVLVDRGSVNVQIDKWIAYS